MESGSTKIFLQWKPDIKTGEPLICSKITVRTLLEKLVIVSIREHTQLRHLPLHFGTVKTFTDIYEIWEEIS